MPDLPKCSVFIAISADGFIARTNDDVSWLERPEYSVSPPPGLSYDEFIATVDCLVMGRNTYEKVLTFSEWPYTQTPVMVLTSRPLDIPPHLEGKVFTGKGTPEEIVQKLAAEGKKHLYIDGGSTIQQFLLSGLIDELTITQIPVLLGGGIPLFGQLGEELQLELIETNSAASGFVQLRYKVMKPT